MFTGLIEATGRVRVRRGSDLEIEVPEPFRALPKGSSVAVDGVCLTVVSRAAGRLGFEMVEETRRRTTLSSLKVGQTVNLERPLKTGSRLEGHLVLGHVDCVGIIRKISGDKDSVTYRIDCSRAFGKMLIPKGSVAVDGISLTLGKTMPSEFWVYLIPHTLKATGLSAKKEGDRVNLEADVLAKLAQKGGGAQAFVDKLFRSL